MSTGVGVNVSKAVAYAVLAKPVGVNVSKAVAYVALSSGNFNPPVWPSFTFAAGAFAVPYSQQWDLAPASSPTTYTVVSGALPGGLAVTSPSNDLGVLSGTPTATGTFTFTLRATNVFGTADKAFTMTVSSGGGGSYVFLA